MIWLQREQNCRKGAKLFLFTLILQNMLNRVLNFTIIGYNKRCFCHGYRESLHIVKLKQNNCEHNCIFGHLDQIYKIALYRSTEFTLNFLVVENTFNCRCGVCRFIMYIRTLHFIVIKYSVPCLLLLYSFDWLCKWIASSCESLK